MIKYLVHLNVSQVVLQIHMLVNLITVMRRTVQILSAQFVILIVSLQQLHPFVLIVLTTLTLKAQPLGLVNVMMGFISLPKLKQGLQLVSLVMGIVLFVIKVIIQIAMNVLREDLIGVIRHVLRVVNNLEIFIFMMKNLILVSYVGITTILLIGRLVSHYPILQL